jgi:L-fuconolactonase
MRQTGLSTVRPPAEAELLEIEPIMDPDLPICDAHHHLWNRPDQCYLLPEFLEDTGTGHNVRSSVYVEWRSHYRETGPIAMRPVGETEFANAVAANASGGSVQVCAAIVGYADLTLGAAVVPILEAHLEAGKGRFKGIRVAATWDSDTEVTGGPAIAPPGLYLDAGFREGFAALGRWGLTFDAWVYQTQLDDLIDLANAFPHQPIVLNHTGGVLGVRSYAGKRSELFSSWRASMQELAKCVNVCVKLGGLGMKRSGFPFHGKAPADSSETIAIAWRPWLETCIEEFGSARCMFESNFPVDRASCSYRVLWNVFKRVATGASDTEKIELLHGTASRFYGIE